MKPPCCSSSGQEIRLACRQGDWTGPTAGLAVDFAQANLVIVPAEFAEDFGRFCDANPRPCPLLEVTAAGQSTTTVMAVGADLRTDLPCYRVWTHGRLTAEPSDVIDFWRDDFVSFLLGCSFTFDDALARAGIPVRHVDEGCNVPMYRTNIPCREAGRFRGPLVVSMRPLPADLVRRADEVTSAFPHFHGAPIHQGNPEHIGIADIAAPEFGDTVPIRDGEIPVFWACGVTPQCALLNAQLPLAITHRPGHMFVTDCANDELLREPFSR